ncbi:hypothetical protein ACFQH6_19800 [Halobacteriaceae archaeon GCM10025711]
MNISRRALIGAATVSLVSLSGCVKVIGKVLVKGADEGAPLVDDAAKESAGGAVRIAARSGDEVIESEQSPTATSSSITYVGEHEIDTTSEQILILEAPEPNLILEYTVEMKSGGVGRGLVIDVLAGSPGSLRTRDGCSLTVDPVTPPMSKECRLDNSTHFGFRLTPGQQRTKTTGELTYKLYK